MSAVLLRANSLSIPLADNSVDLVITSPPYFAMRSYRDEGGHYDGQIGAEPSAVDFLLALWAVMDELHRVMKPKAPGFVNLSDKYAGSGGHNNNGLTRDLERAGDGYAEGKVHVRTKHASRALERSRATRRQAPDRYNQDRGGALPKSLMGLPWRFALGCFLPDDYRAPFYGPVADATYPDMTVEPGPFPQWLLRAPLVWNKPNGLPESVVDRPRYSHEDWFMFAKQGRYFANLDPIREPHVGAARDLRNRDRGDRTADANDRWGHRERKRTDLPPQPGEVGAYHPLGKLPGTVWTIPTEPLHVPAWLDVDHFAAFPSEWPRRLILGWSPKGICLECDEGRWPTYGRPCEECAELIPLQVKKCGHCGHVRDWKSERFLAGDESCSDAGASIATDFSTPGDKAPRRVPVPMQTVSMGERCGCKDTLAPTRPAVVLDPFAGSGTTVMVARALGRFGIGLDLSADYLRLARWRIWESAGASRARERTNRANQGVMFV